MHGLLAETTAKYFNLSPDAKHTLPEARGIEVKTTKARKLALSRSIRIPNHLAVTRYAYQPYRKKHRAMIN